MSGITRGEFGQIRHAAKTAQYNEQVTRKRVEVLEAAIGKAASILGRTLWGRLKWLVLGR